MSDNHDNYEVPRGERPAVAAPPDLHARYETDDGATCATLRIYAFSAEGHPLVLKPGDTRLVRPEVAETKMTYVGIHVPFGPPLAGPFTPAPTGLVAVFADGPRATGAVLRPARPRGADGSRRCHMRSGAGRDRH